MFVDRVGHFYFGDMQYGDRLATPEEEAQFEADQAAAKAAQDAKDSDKTGTITDPYVAAIAAMTRQQVLDHIDATFPALTTAQRNVLKAMGLVCRLFVNTI